MFNGLGMLNISHVSAVYCWGVLLSYWVNNIRLASYLFVKGKGYEVVVACFCCNCGNFCVVKHRFCGSKAESKAGLKNQALLELLLNERNLQRCDTFSDCDIEKEIKELGQLLEQSIYTCDDYPLCEGGILK